MRFINGALVVLLLAACSSSRFVVRRVDQPKVPGSVVALSDIVGNTDNGVIVIFVHGVGDHCPGYALNNDVGWLNSGVANLMGLIPDNSPERPDQLNPLWRRDPAHGGGPRDESDPSWFAISHRTYDLRNDPSKKVLAIELTWSGLTQWLKVKQLGFDLTKPIVPAPEPPPPNLHNEDQLLTCLKMHPAEFDQKRLLLNRVLKEDVLDRSLSDAVLYVGSNGSKINEAMSETICRAVTGDFTQDSCSWEKAKNSITAKPRGIVFVTHSLGSRIVYDTLLELAGKPLRAVDGEISTSAGCPKDNPDPDAAAKSAVALAIGQDSSAVYMMANQLPLLGLTYIPPSYSNEQTTMPFLKIASAAPEIRTFAQNGSGKSLAARVEEAAAAHGMRASPHTLDQAERNIARIDCRQYSLICFAQYIVAMKNQAHPTTLHDPSKTRFRIVAFSDTDDLLTWALPPPYADPSVYLSMDFTNVFVQNSTRWIGIFENPAAAHGGYFTSKSVRRVIVCGADGDKLKAPCN